MKNSIKLIITGLLIASQTYAQSNQTHDSVPSNANRMQMEQNQNSKQRNPNHDSKIQQGQVHNSGSMQDTIMRHKNRNNSGMNVDSVKTRNNTSKGTENGHYNHSTGNGTMRDSIK